MGDAEASSSRTVALLGSAASHLLWGLHPVCSRYLQTVPMLPLDGVNLLAVGQLLALTVNLVASFAAAKACPEGGSGGQGCGDGGGADHKGAYEKVASDPRSAEDVDLESVTVSSGGGDGGGGTDLVIAPAFSDKGCAATTEGDAGCEPPPRMFWGWSRVAVSTALVFGIAAALRAVTNVLSGRYTEAYNVQLVAMGGPLVTALTSRALIGEEVPWALWPALAVAGAGEAAAVSAHARPAAAATASTAAAGAGAASGARGLVAGCGLQLLSLVFSGVARVVMKTSATAGFSPEQLMAVQYTFTAVPGLALSCLRPGRRRVWASWLALPLEGWAVFGALVFGVMLLAATAQVHAVRRLGPAGHAALQPLRLLSTVAASRAVLGEQLSGARQWLGLALVATALGWYVAVGERLPPSSAPCAGGPRSSQDWGVSTAEAKAAKSALAKSKSKTKRWWFQRLLWPKPAFRPGKSAIAADQASALFKDANNRERDDGGAHERRRRRRPPGGSPEGGGIDGGGSGSVGSAVGLKAGRAPGAAMAMVRSEADEAALDSDEDLFLLTGLGATASARRKPKAAGGGAGAGVGGGAGAGVAGAGVGSDRQSFRRGGAAAGAGAAAAAGNDARRGQSRRESRGARFIGREDNDDGGAARPSDGPSDGSSRSSNRRRDIGVAEVRGSGGEGSDGGSSSGGARRVKGSSRRKKQRDRDRDDLRNIRRSSRSNM